MSEENGQWRTPLVAKNNLPNHAPAGWRWVRLTEVAKLESGHTPSRSEPSYWNGNVQWLSLKDVRALGDKYITETADHPTPEGIENSSARMLPKGTVALSRTASVGKAVILGCDMATSQDFVNWVCGPELLPEYLYYAFRSSEAEFDRLQQGTTHKTIYMPIAEQFCVLLPPVPTQHRIAAILDKAEAIRRKREEGIRLTEELVRSTFLERFGDPVANPKGWPRLFLEEISGDMTYGTNVKCGEESHCSLPVLRIPNILHGRINWNHLKYATVDSREKEQLLLSPGDLLFVRTNGNPEYIGRCAMFTGNTRALFASYLIRVRLSLDAEYRPEFVRFVATMPSYRSLLVAEARTTAGNYNISTQGLRRLKLIAPPLEHQDRFLQFAAKTSTILAKREEAATTAATLFDSLVQRAFRGDL
jgi:type I restriction enzyme S subunit